MTRCRRSRDHVFAGLGLSLLAWNGVASAGDMSLKAPAVRAVYSWTGFYLGGHVGYGGGSFGPEYSGCQIARRSFDSHYAESGAMQAGIDSQNYARFRH